MNKATLLALKGSIKKWEDIVAGTKQDLGDENCPLCKRFLVSKNKETCEGCPVREKTGQSLCGGSPYEAWHREQARLEDRADQYRERYADTPELQKLARAELKFLRSLMPKADGKKLGAF